MTILEDTKYILKNYKVAPNKNLGQNFLTNEEVLDTIASQTTKQDVAIEIGPGIGNLTAKLLNSAKKVIAIELDDNMIKILKERFIAYNNLEIINCDILKVDIETLLKKEGIKDYSKVKVIANIPYYITTPIIIHLLKSPIQDITILIQKEVADRICLAPGKKGTGAITYYINYFADTTRICEVDKTNFVPSPKVDSTLINLKKLSKPRVEVKNEKLFFNIIRANFSNRRKNIVNSLSNVIEKKKLLEILIELGISTNTRGETLTLEQFAKIANMC